MPDAFKPLGTAKPRKGPISGKIEWDSLAPAAVAVVADTQAVTIPTYLYIELMYFRSNNDMFASNADTSRRKAMADLIEKRTGGLSPFLARLRHSVIRNGPFT